MLNLLSEFYYGRKRDQAEVFAKTYVPPFVHIGMGETQGDVSHLPRVIERTGERLSRKLLILNFYLLQKSIAFKDMRLC